MRQANVYYKDMLSGVLTENDEGYEFCYLSDYLSLENAKPVSLTLPLQEQIFKSSVLFPFVDGLIPEGWLLNIASDSWKINKNDRMGLLLACCQNTIGAVSIHPIINKENE